MTKGQAYLVQVVFGLLSIPLLADGGMNLISSKGILIFSGISVVESVILIIVGLIFLAISTYGTITYNKIRKKTNK